MSVVYAYTFLSVLIVSLISLVGLFTLSLGDRLLRRYLFLFVSLATGALLGDAFIHIIPESFRDLDARLAGVLVIVGMLLFFILEKAFHWHHYHGKESDAMHLHDGEIASGDGLHPVGKMVLISDGVHNFMDGVIIAASYLAGLHVGIATTIAVILHEIPQEIGDFGVLLHAGYTKKHALFLNFITALLAVLGAVVVVVVGRMIDPVISWIVPISAGGFIYIAASDLIPELHRVKGGKKSIAQFCAIVLGVLAMILLLYMERGKPQELPTQLPLVYQILE